MKKHRPRAVSAAPEISSPPEANELDETFVAELTGRRECPDQLIRLVTLEADCALRAQPANSVRCRCRHHNRAVLER